MNHRINCLKEKMNSLDLQGIIISKPENIKYLIGTNAEGTLLINEKEVVFVTDARYIEEVNNTITLYDEINVRDIANISENDCFAFFNNCNKVGIEENYITYANYGNLIRKYRIKEATETNYIIEKMRIIKSEIEIEKIEKACNITDECFLHILRFIKIGMTEKQIAFEIERFFIDNNADGTAFETIVASGENTSKPHSIPTDRKIKKGDAILIDFGAKYDGYCADMTRTIFVGEVNNETKELYNFILDGQIRAFNKMKNGSDGKSIAKGIQDEYDANNYSLMHALGHGVGLEIHEMPYLSTRISHTLKENMVVTNEPGIYIPGKIGIRIEDTVLINNMSARNLTKSNKNLIII